MESMDELISQAADFISSLLPFLNNINIVGLILSFVSLVLSVLLCFWGYRLFTCFTAGIGFVTGAFLGFLLSGHYFTDELWIILLSALILGLILGFLATRLILLSTFFVVLILVSVFSCGLLVSFVPSLSNVMAGIISLILGIGRWCDLYKTAKTYHNSRHCLLRCTRHGTNFISAFKI